MSESGIHRVRELTAEGFYHEIRGNNPCTSRKDGPLFESFSVNWFTRKISSAFPLTGRAVSSTSGMNRKNDDVIIICQSGIQPVLMDDEPTVSGDRHIGFYLPHAAVKDIFPAILVVFAQQI